MLAERAQQWALLICSKDRVQKTDFSGLDISGYFDIKTRGLVFCIALGPVAICIPIGRAELLQVTYFTIKGDILNAWNRAASK